MPPFSQNLEIANVYKALKLIKFFRKIFSTFSVVLFCCTTIVSAQGTPFPCADDDCGDFTITFGAPGSQTEFCEGTTITLQNNSDPDFERYIVDWADGSVDTNAMLTDVFSHQYTLTDEEACEGGSLFAIAFGANLICDDAQSCQSGTLNFRINPAPRALINAPMQACTDQPIRFNSNSCNGHTYSWDFGSAGNSTDENPSITFDQPGIYNVSLIVTGDPDDNCGMAMDEATHVINVVNPPDAVFTVAGDVDENNRECRDAILTFDANSNQWSSTTWSISPNSNNDTRWCYTDTTMNAGSEIISVQFKQLGTYTITLTGSNVCDDETAIYEIEILDAPSLGLNSEIGDCDQVVATPNDLGFNLSGAFSGVEWTFINAEGITTSDQEDFGSVTWNQSGSATITVFGDCGQLSRTIEVNVESSEAVSLGTNSPYCSGDALDTLTASSSGGRWAGPGIINATQGIFDPGQANIGSNLITYTPPANFCDNSTQITIEVLESASMELDETIVGCDEVTITPATVDFSVTGEYTSLTWTFVNAEGTTEFIGEDFGSVTWNESGTATVTLSGSCGDFTRTLEVTVEINEIAILTADSFYCSGDGLDTLTASVPNGEWDGPGIINRTLGVFDPGVAGPGIHTIDYFAETGECNNSNSIEIEVRASADVNIEALNLCEDGSPVIIAVTPPDGTFPDQPFVDSDARTFDPTAAGPGQYNILYDFDDGSCAVEGVGRAIVARIPELMVDDTIDVCYVDDVIDLLIVSSISADSSGGDYIDWAVNGTPVNNGMINPFTDLPGPGTYPVSVAYNFAPCQATTNFFLTVEDQPDLLLTPADTNICISTETIQLEANLSGGIWSGQGVDPITGIITVANAGIGGTYNYIFSPGNSCRQSGSINVEIEDPGEDIDAGNPESFCEGQGLSFTLAPATPSGGRWLGIGVTEAGDIDLTQLTPGESYDYIYEVVSSTATNCSATAIRSFTYNPRPDPRYSIAGSLCISEEFCLEMIDPTGIVDWQWAFGDNDTSTSEAPCHSYVEGGDFIQSLTVVSVDGCPADTSMSVYVTTPPSPAFALDSMMGCAPFVLNIEDQSMGDDFTVTYFVGGDTLSDPPLGYVIDSVTVDTWVTIEAQAENFCGLRSAIDSVLVFPYPFADFGLDLDDGCSPFTPKISNTTIGQPNYYSWDMGEGTFGTDSIPPVISYTTPDDSVSTYVITLIAGNDCGEDTIRRTLSVHPPDVDAFISLDTVSGCSPWAFEPQSFSTPGSAQYWVIVGPMGDTINSSDVFDPEFTLRDTGIYTVYLTASRCGADTDTAFVEVFPAPIASFISDPQVCLGEEVIFTNTSPNPGGVSWEFGDGEGSVDLSPTHIYDTAGSYPVSMTVSSPLNGCSTTISSNISVTELPIPIFTPSDTAGCTPLTVSFEQQSIGQEPLEYFWEFGTGNPSQESAPVFTYQDSGRYVVRLTVTDGFGCANDTTHSFIRVFPDPIVEIILVDNELCAGHDSLRVLNQTTGATGFTWTVYGEEIIGEDFPALAVTEAGMEEIQLVATNQQGCSTSTSAGFEVLPSPTASILLTDSLCLNQAVSLQSNSTNATSLEWDLGDNTGSNDESFSHIFPAGDIYEIELIARNNNGCPSDTATRSLTIHSLPSADFSTLVPEDCGTPARVVFTNASEGSTSYQWNFGDGQNSTQANPSNLYNSAGTFTALLTAENTFGCLDSTSQTITVRSNPIANVNLPDRLRCTPYRLTLNADTTEAVRYEWYLNDMVEPYVGRTLDTLLESVDFYDIRLVAIFDEVCRDTFDASSFLALKPGVVADFDYESNQLPNILGDVQFINLSEVANLFYWDLGDGEFSRLPSPYHEYEINRDILVTLFAERSYPGGLVCRDSIQKPIAPEWLTTFYVPTAMSPQAGPPETRLFGAKGVGVVSYTLTVYSPYGEVVFVTSELEEGRPSGRWEGKFPNSEEYVPQGAYTWRAEYEFVDGNAGSQTGTVTVLR